MSVPTTVGLLSIEVRAQTLGKPNMVHDEPGVGTLRVQLEFDDRVDPFRPIADTPSLNDAPIGYKLDVSPSDDPAKTRKGAARVTIDLCRRTPGEFAELLRVEQSFIELLRACLEQDFLMDWFRHFFLRGFAGPLVHNTM